MLVMGVGVMLWDMGGDTGRERFNSKSFVGKVLLRIK